MSGFGRSADGVERAFEPWERHLLRRLCSDLLVLLGVADQARHDPALSRLLPNAYPEDREAAVEFAAFARPRLTSAKVESAQAILDDLANGDHVHLGADRVPLWLRGLTDLRLVLAERAAADPDPALKELSDWLGWVLSDLLDAADEEMRSDRE